MSASSKLFDFLSVLSERNGPRDAEQDTPANPTLSSAALWDDPTRPDPREPIRHSMLP